MAFLKRSLFAKIANFRREYATSELIKMTHGNFGRHEIYPPAPQKFDRLSLCSYGMTNTRGIPPRIREQIKHFGEELRFPVLSCDLFKQALSLSTYRDCASKNLDLRIPGREVLRILFTRHMYFLLKGFCDTSEAEAASHRLLSRPTLFHDFAFATKLASYILPLEDNKLLGTEYGNPEIQQLRCVKCEEKFLPLKNWSTDDGIRNISFAVAGAVYLDSADTNDVEQVFFPHFTRALEEEATFSMAKEDVNYEETKPEYIQRKFRMDCLEEELIGLEQAV